MNIRVADLPPSPTPVRIPVTGAMFDMLAEAGLLNFTPDVELRDGEIVQMSPQYLPHARVQAELLGRLYNAVHGSDVRVLVEATVAADPRNRPMPDICLVTSAAGRGAVPVERVRLAVEVSASTLGDDLGFKARIYAAAGIPEYWVVDVDGRLIYRFWNPVGRAYASDDEVNEGISLAVPGLAGVTVDTAGLFDD